MIARINQHDAPACGFHEMIGSRFVRISRRGNGFGMTFHHGPWFGQHVAGSR
jgi:hypothetical protein